MMKNKNQLKIKRWNLNFIETFAREVPCSSVKDRRSPKFFSTPPSVLCKLSTNGVVSIASRTVIQDQ